MIRSVPNINTARLTLRAMRPEDFDRFAEIWAMPEVVRFIGGKPRDRAEAWNSFLRNAGHWQMTGFGQWAIVEQRSRQMIGQVGFFYGTRGLGPDFDAFPEGGWVLAPRSQGKGYGAEAAEAAHDWFDRVIPGPLVALVSAANTRSLEIAERLGYRPMRQVDDADDPVVLLRRDRPPQANSAT